MPKFIDILIRRHHAKKIVKYRTMRYCDAIDKGAPMHVISNKRLVEFAQEHPGAEVSLQVWRKLMESNAFAGFNDLKRTFSSVDVVGDKFVFDIRGNHY